MTRTICEHCAVTLGSPCPGGGYTPEAEVWVAVEVSAYALGSIGSW